MRRWPWGRIPVEPPAPEGVRVYLHDGTTRGPLVIIYIGQEDGQYIWEAMWPVGIRPSQVESVRVDRLPSHSSIRMAQP